MNLRPLSKLYCKLSQPLLSVKSLYVVSGFASHCKRSAKSSGSSSALKRPMYGGKVRLGFLPDEWFTFFHGKTGVSGGYLLMLNFVNYCVSKEIYVMEHEYYCGLSIALMVYLITTKAGKDIGASLDKDVDAVVESFEKDRKLERAHYQTVIKDCKFAQACAEGQKLLMDAKKENVQMQLEAIYRERCMHVYKAVKGRMDYHLKKSQAEARIHQRWMVDWVLKNVLKSITPEFQAAALSQAIKDIEAVAGRA